MTEYYSEPLQSFARDLERQFLQLQREQEGIVPSAKVASTDTQSVGSLAAGLPLPTASVQRQTSSTSSAQAPRPFAQPTRLFAQTAPLKSVGTTRSVRAQPATTTAVPNAAPSKQATEDTEITISYRPPADYPVIPYGDLFRHVNFEGEDYELSSLLHYLHSPGSKRVPHTKRKMSQRQAQNVVALLSAGMDPVYVDTTSEAAYSVPLGKKLDDRDKVALREYIAMKAAAQEGLVADKDLLTLTLLAYTDTLASMLGDYYRTKPAVNFGVARFINSAAQGSPMGEDLEQLYRLLSRETADPSTVQTLQKSPTVDGIQQPLSARLSDEEFLLRLENVDTAELWDILSAAGIIGASAADPLPTYQISARDLNLGTAIMPPFGYSVLDNAIRSEGYDDIRLPLSLPRASAIKFIQT